ncbi:MAG: 6-phosphogluconolactonase [Gammaproteobacteria bacterium]|nr:MAG: 6-phosphogluconolactonase [Gammaproteobacteria bacterium]
MPPALRVFDDLEALGRAAAERWVSLCAEAIAARGAFHVALSGGTTPYRLYQHLACNAFSSRIDWSKVHIYFTDERCVPHDHPDSNYRMASEALLNHVPVPSSQIHAIEADLAYVRERAAAYSRVLDINAPRAADGGAWLDLMMLGMGPDGHIASLFPASGEALRDKRLAVAVYAQSRKSWRISVTFPVINQARHIQLLVAGEGKAKTVAQAFAPAPGAAALPVQMIKPAHEMEWYLDAAAASLLPPAS